MTTTLTVPELLARLDAPMTTEAPGRHRAERTHHVLSTLTRAGALTLVTLVAIVAMTGFTSGSSSAQAATLPGTTYVCKVHDHQSAKTATHTQTCTLKKVTIKGNTTITDSDIVTTTTSRSLKTGKVTVHKHEHRTHVVKVKVA